MNVTYYTNFSKRINSTKIPTGGTIVAMKLKYPTSIERPAFIVVSIPTTCTYLKWDNRYYYVTGIEYKTATEIIITCELDVLATFKSQILATKAFVEYAQSEYNADILDPRISNTASVLKDHTSDLSLQSVVSGEGTYIVTAIGQTGAATRYAMSAADLAALGNFISTGITDSVAEQLSKRFGSPFETILNCIWIPFSLSTSGDTVYLGNVACTGFDAHIVNDLITHAIDTTITIPYCHTEKCRKDTEKIVITLPGYGQTTLDPAEIDYAATLDLHIRCDINGNILYSIDTPQKRYIFHGDIGVSIPITRFNTSLRGMILNNLSTSPAGRNQTAETMGSSDLQRRLYGNGHIFNIVSRLKAIGASSSSIGGQGGAVLARDVYRNPTILVECYSYAFAESQANMADRYGRPLFAVRTLSNFTGYVKTNGASVDLPGFEDEKDKVNGFLNGGIFIE